MSTVVLVTEPFSRVARSSAIARGLPKLPIIVLPADFDELDGAGVRAIVDQRLDEIVGSLSRERI